MIKNFTIEGSKLCLIKPVDKDPVREEKEEIVEKHHFEPGRLLINNEPADHYQYTLAHCCNPVQGDDIFAYVTANSGMKIHRINCPNAENLMVNYGYRILKAEWTSISGSRYTVDLNITGIDDGPGVIERLTHNISSILGVNIKSFSIVGHEGTFEGKVGLIVSNKDQINQIIQSLSQLPGISNVSRVIH